MHTTPCIQKRARWPRRAGWLAPALILLLLATVAEAQRPENSRLPGDLLSLTTHYRLDMRIKAVSKALDEQLNLKGEGVLVEQVEAGGPADKAGIKANDILLAIGERPIKKPADLERVIAEGKEFSVKLLRGGKPVTVSVTPGQLELNLEVAPPKDLELKEKAVREKLSEIEKMVREKLKDAGIDGLRMQLLQPGKIFPPGFPFPNGPPEFPDDLSITIHKHGKSPAEIEVKKGDQTWTVKENDLAALADEVRPQVEAFLGRGPRFNLHSHAGPWGPEGAGRPGPPPGHPDGPPPGPDGPPPGAGRGPRERGGPGPDDGALGDPDQRGQRRRGSLEQRLEGLTGSLERMRDELEALRRGIREERRRGE